MTAALSEGAVRELVDVTCDLHELLARLVIQAGNHSADKIEILNHAGLKLRALRDELGMESNHE